MNQNYVTVIIGFFCMAIPLSFLAFAVKRTPRRGYACPSCDHDVPAGNSRCPHCGAAMPDMDQPL